MNSACKALSAVPEADTRKLALIMEIKSNQTLESNEVAGTEAAKPSADATGPDAMNRSPLPPPLTRKADRHLSAIENFLDQPLLFLLVWLQRKHGPRGGRLGPLLRGVRVAALVLKLAVLGSLLGDHLSDMTEWMVATPEYSTPIVTVRVLIDL